MEYSDFYTTYSEERACHHKQGPITDPKGKKYFPVINCPICHGDHFEPIEDSGERYVCALALIVRFQERQNKAVAS